MMKHIAITILLSFCVLSFAEVNERNLKREDILAKKFVPVTGRLVEDRWVFVFNPNTNDEVVQEISDYIENTLGGYSVQVWSHADGTIAEWGNIVESEVEEIVEKYFDVIKFTECVSIQQFAAPYKVHAEVVQPDAPWGLDRIDQRSLPLDGQYEYNYVGTNVHVYVVDSGIRVTHQQFGGRANNSFSAYDDDGYDCNGHGTHVAGIVGGSTYGAAKNVLLYNVKVLDCAGEGSTSDVVSGMNYVSENHIKPAIAQMSIGGSGSRTIDEAVSRLKTNGVMSVVAAGNDDNDACEFSPSRSSDVFAVGATTESDLRAEFSNYGECVRMFAPGVRIESASHVSDTATAFMSGTSMAAPFVSGVASFLLQRDPSMTPDSVMDSLQSYGTSIAGLNTGGGPNLLLYSNIDGVASAPLVSSPSPASSLIVEYTTASVVMIAIVLFV